MIAVLVADDHKIFRDGVRRILEDGGSMKVVAEAADSRQAIQLVGEHEPDVVLLDIRMPGRGPLETVQEIKTRSPKTRVLMLTAQPEDFFAVRVLRAGADGYLTKDAGSNELREAIRRVVQGRKYISPALAETIALSVDSDTAAAPHLSLSRRELEVMVKLAQGRTVQEIADELALSPKTVSTYRTRVLEKLHLSSNADIVRYAIRVGLVE